MPVGTTFVSADAQVTSGTTPSGGVTSTPPVGSGGVVTATATLWPAGTSVSFHIVVKVNQLGTIFNAASVSLTSADPDVSNNIANATTNIQPQPSSVPTMNEWGMILFVVLAGFGSIYYLRRQKRANS